MYRVIFARVLLFLWVAAAAMFPEKAWAQPGGGVKNSTRESRSAKTSKTKARGKKAAFRGRGVFSGLRVGRIPRPSGNIHLSSVNYRDDIKVNIYTADGSYNEESLARLDHFVRSRGAGTQRVIEPKLYEILSHIYDRFGGRVIEFVSGFRDQPRETSYHYLGSAMDIRVRGVSVRELRNYVSTLDTGGMGLGLYPRVGFIHVDIRPEPSYYWTDWSGHTPTKKKVSSRKVPRS